jgi:ribosome-associated protein
MSKEVKKAAVLAEIIVKGMLQKKAKNIIKIDLRGVNASVADYFVICHGDSDRQVKAIADSVEEEVREAINEKPLSREGESVCRWVLVDYVNVVVHIFIREVRDFYEIEELWNDGEFTYYNENVA